MHRWRNLLLAGGCYLLFSLVIWWHVWSSHPTSTILCGCGDTSQFVWFLEWPAYALSHGLNPFYSTAAAYPHGVNLLAYTSVLAIGIPLAPVTWIFGPIATLNVALLLSPVLSGLAMFILLRRWVAWEPAAFVGGVAYGFSPLILTNLDFSHLNLTMSPVPPLVVACLDEIVIRQRRRPVATGVLLGLLLTLQFFLSTELLGIMALLGAFGLVVLIAYTAWRRPQALRRHFRFAVVGLAAGAIVAAVLLAYPAWFALAGPAHVSGAVWSNPGQYVSHLQNYVIAHPGLPIGWLYGFDGVPISGQYLGIGLLVVLLGGLVIWRRDLRFLFFAILAVVSMSLSLGAANPVFGSRPLVQNILPNRFDQVVYLAVAIMLGIVVDHSYAWVTQWYMSARRGGAHSEVPLAEEHPRGVDPVTTERAHTPRVSWAGALAGLIVAAVALVPIGLFFSQNFPMPVQSSPRVPAWFQTVGRHLGPKQVLLVLPDNLSVLSPMIWQVADGMRYAIVDDVGASGSAARVPAGLRVLVTASLPAYASGSYANAPLIVTPDNIAAVRSSLQEWGVTMVVIPDQPGLVRLAQLSSVPAAAALITAATGQRPDYEEGAWVWSAVNRPGPPIIPSTLQFSQCTNSDTDSRGTAAVDAVVACIATKGPFARIVTSANGLNLIQHRLLMSTVADSVAITNVAFVMTNQETSGSLTVPARRFFDGSLEGWVANTDALSLPNGKYTLRSVANDAAGVIGRSPAVTVGVDDKTSAALPPETRLVRPLSHEQVSGTKNLLATASSVLGVKSVEFRITGNGRTIIENAASSLVGWFAGWNTRSVPNGTYMVSSVADGNTGLVSTSRGVAVKVKNSA